MKKSVRLFNRLVLTFGVLVALTPCGFCKNITGVGASKMSHCSMTKMDGQHNCCQSKKSQSPLCKIMDQSSTASASKASVLAAKPVVSIVAVETLLSVRVCAVPSFRVVSASPPPGTLALRI